MQRTRVSGTAASAYWDAASPDALCEIREEALRDVREKDTEKLDALEKEYFSTPSPFPTTGYPQIESHGPRRKNLQFLLELLRKYFSAPPPFSLSVYLFPATVHSSVIK